MTTIAYRDGIMAADSQCTSDGVRVPSIRKIVRGPNGLCGCCGDGALIRGALAWFSGGETAERPGFGDDLQALIVRPGGAIEWWSENGYSEHLDAPYFAIGSGRDIALAALHCGKSSVEAVGVAAVFDVNTGGPISLLSLSPAT